MSESVDVVPVSETLCVWNVPDKTNAAPCEITARRGRFTTIVGANGAGKSALGLWMERNSGATPVRRLIAHRRLWFQHAGPEITPAQNESTRRNAATWSRQDDSRYLDHVDGQRTGMVLLDLLSMIIAEQARRLTMYEEDRATPEDVVRQVGPPLLARINAILRSAGLAVTLRLTDHQTFHADNATKGVEYPIFHMSDGEKSAVLLAAEVLTTPAGSIAIIDEPERHLHRSISAGLVAAIIADRPDLHFVILTHDLELATALTASSAGQTYALTDCGWIGDRTSTWDLFAVDADAAIPESARRAILGGRRDLLFIEGEAHSLDLGLYRLLYPSWTLFPAGGCDQVIRAVVGLADSQSHHWINARGMVDGDGRTDGERSALLARGVATLPVNEIENLYYSEAVIKAVAIKQAESLDTSAEVMQSDARTAALRALAAAGTSEHLAAGLALSVARRKVLEELPTTIDAKADPVSVTFPSPYPQIFSEIQSLLNAGDLNGLIKLVPVRDSSMRAAVATALRFRNASDYETAARTRVRDDATLADELRALIGPMP